MAKKPHVQDSRESGAETLAKTQPGAPPRKRLIIFVHGIRDPGYWQQDLKQLFEAEGFVAAPIGYGVFDIFRFIFGARSRAVAEVKMKIMAIIDNHRDEKTREVPEITILAHSFGTYVISRILDNDPTIDIFRLVMCGGIVSNRFRWDKLATLNGQFGRRVDILNEHSAKDIWPLFAKHITLGFGSSGTIGCQDGANVKDRRHDIPHSDYLTRDFAEKYWVPYIARNMPLSYNTVQAGTPWYTNLLLRSPLTLLQALALFLTVSLAFVIYDKISYRTQGVLAYESDETGLNFLVHGRRSRNEDWQPLFSARTFSATPEHRLLSMSRYNSLRVEISNRRPVNCNPDSLEDQITDQAPGVKTTYEFDLSRAHRWFGKTDISFTYSGQVEAENGKKIDRLMVSAEGGLDQKALRLRSVKHEGDKCLDENNPFDALNPDSTPFVKYAQLETDEFRIASLITPAWAKDMKKPDRARLLRSLKSENPRVVDDSIDALSTLETKDKAKTTADIASLVRNKQLPDEALAKLLVAARENKSASFKLDASLIAALTYHDNVKVRDAARSYARSPLNDDAAMIQAFETEIGKNLAVLRLQTVEGKNYGKDYLLLIAARDVYYNLGIKMMEQHLVKLQSGEKSDFSRVAAVFNKGQDLRKHASDPKQMVSLAKNTYGLALAETRSAALSQALRSSGGKDAIGFIMKAREANEPIADNKSGKTFAQFLQETTAFEGLYPWQNHIDVAKRCTKALTYACYNSSASAE
jgi:hypothetical protein